MSHKELSLGSQTQDYGRDDVSSPQVLDKARLDHADTRSHGSAAAKIDQAET